MPSEDSKSDQLRDKIIGLGEHSYRKSYYPELQQRLADLKRSEETYREIFEATEDGILLLDTETGETVDVNDAMCKLYGLTRDEAMRTDFLSYYAGRSYDREGILNLFREARNAGPRRSVHRSRTSSGRIFWAEYSMKSVVILGKERMMAIVRDVTERWEAERKIEASLREKEVMLKEIHHRVKNNLQVISSLLNVQSRYVADPRDADLFKESQHRVQTMALVHEKLYQSRDLACIDFSAYIDSLMKTLFYSYALGRTDIAMRAETQPISLTVDRAVPCGLIVNELISNSLKHAFPGDRGGEIKVSIGELDGLVVIEVSDDGVGMPEGFDIRASESLGLQLVNMLVEQLDGSIALDREKGTRFTIAFRRE